MEETKSNFVSSQLSKVGDQIPTKNFEKAVTISNFQQEELKGVIQSLLELQLVLENAFGKLQHVGERCKIA